MTKPQIPKITAIATKYINRSAFIGSVIAVSKNRSVLHFDAQGSMDQARKSPMREDAIFRMASSTKPILGVAAMMMIENQLFSPSDPIQKYIPEFNDIQVAVLEESELDLSPEYVLGKPPPYRLVKPHRAITIHDLLTHTSGIATYGLGMAVADWKWKQGESLASWIPKIASGPLDYQPGARWAYSPTVGLDIVARIIEIVSGMEFDDLVQRKIFDPLGMRDTHWHLPDHKTSRLVFVEESHKKLYSGPKKGLDVPEGYFSGSIGLMSTALDYLRFQEMLLNEGVLDGHRVLAEESVKRMCGNRMDIPYTSKGGDEGLGFGYTVEVTLDPLKSANFRTKGAHGWEGYFGTISWTEPEIGLAAVILVQSIPSKTFSIKDFHNEVCEALHASL